MLRLYLFKHITKKMIENKDEKMKLVRFSGLVKEQFKGMNISLYSELKINFALQQ